MIFFVSLQTSSDDDRINSKEIDNPKIELLFHETTKNFDRLPIQYRVSMKDFFFSIKERLLLGCPAKVIQFSLALNYYAA